AAVRDLEVLFAAAPTLDAVPAREQQRLRGLAPTHFAELWPHVEQEAEAQAHDVERKLKLRGESEAEALRKIIGEQIRLAERTLGQQLTLSFNESEREQREQHERDRKHIDARRKALSRELEDEPQAILASYEVLRRRLEPVGLVYLWPSTR
ncbi:MAG TPA: hypothetical protein VER33_25095, partial [Polyangiaceae bacterium]|nr:hypothetical protein [Polyangiaceae bacterium]